MHDHHNNSNNKSNGHKSMMWMMAICCLLPVVILFGGVEFFKSTAYGWTGIGLVGIFLIIHFSKMWQAKHDNKPDDQVVESEKEKSGQNALRH